jgi:glycosyltransferase involved in cell wall biosynthesis
MVAAPEISVVVCTRNGERRLPVVLASIAGQTLGRERFEVIVVDDGSTDAAAVVAEKSGARVVRLSGRGRAAARNAGVRAARAPIVAFIDDDCEADEAWLSRLLSAFTDPALDAAGGWVEAGPGRQLLLRFHAARNPIQPRSAGVLRSTNPLYRLWLYLRAATVGPPRLRDGDVLYLAVGANMAMRRALVFDLGGFDEGDVGTEEEDLWRRARARPGGAEIRYRDGASVVHHFDPTLRSTFARARHYGHGHARLAAKHPDVRPIVYPWPVVVASLLAVAAVSRRTRAAAIAGVVPLVGYPRWVADAVCDRSPQPLAYPYLELAWEAQFMVAQRRFRASDYTEASSKYLFSDAAMTPRQELEELRRKRA